MNATLPAEASLGSVHLKVRDLGRSTAYYQEALGFQLHDRDGLEARLGAGAADLLALHERPEARPVSGTTGLYHFAVLVPSRLELARTLKRLADSGARVEGAADHLVSEAIYLSDPDRNGIEIYRDRPRAEWPYLGGQLQMAADPLDLEGIMAELSRAPAGDDGLAAGTRIGHIHLHVAELGPAVSYYTERLGFDLVLRYGPSAAFVSAGGYHHHVGLNTWAGVGAPRPPADAAGLLWYTLLVPDTQDVEALVERITAAGAPAEPFDGGYRLTDPSGNQILVRAEGAPDSNDQVD
ncbi:MAG: VOC family protein [Candidatus Promineifilaceae bacterium]